MVIKKISWIFAWIVLPLLLPLSAQSAEWQELRDGKTRIVTPKAKAAEIKEVEAALPDG
ncbi:MAG: hypothetical protein ACI82A_004614, partial [Candidatus Azotimanducaceae bacterium]